MNCGVFLLLVVPKITLNWICFRGMNKFVLFLFIYSGEKTTVLFSSTKININSGIIFLLSLGLRISISFFEVIEYGDRWRDKNP